LQGQVTFDSTGDIFADKMTLGKFGPDARREQHSFLKEITPEQMASYTSEQLSTILEQRENVRSSHIANARSFDPNRSPRFTRLSTSNGKRILPYL
jgi:hypothetical protein